MYNEENMRLVRKSLLGVVFVLGLLIGGCIGMFFNTSDKKAETDVEETTVVEKSLTQEQVKDFLIAYYTKKDLSENRNRYKPFMTESFYREVVEQEEQPVNQAYKGYVIDQVFEDAEIFIDAEHKVALASVNYHNLNVLTKGSTSGTTLTAKDTIRITYSVEKDQYLVNRIDPVLDKIGEKKPHKRFDPNAPLEEPAEKVTTKEVTTKEATTESTKE